MYLITCVKYKTNICGLFCGTDVVFLHNHHQPGLAFQQGRKILTDVFRVVLSEMARIAIADILPPVTGFRFFVVIH